jgi:hypothetical protein
VCRWCAKVCAVWDLGMWVLQSAPDDLCDLVSGGEIFCRGGKPFTGRWLDAQQPGRLLGFWCLWFEGSFPLSPQPWVCNRVLLFSSVMF